MLGWWALSTLLTSWAVLCLMDGCDDEEEELEENLPPVWRNAVQGVRIPRSLLRGGLLMSAEGLSLASVKTRLHFYRLAQELRMDVARWREWVREAVKEAKRIRAMN
jgi:hypothetical protein